MEEKRARDKRKRMKEEAQEGQTAAENGRQLRGREPRKMAAITNKDGKLLKSKEKRQADGTSTLGESSIERHDQTQPRMRR